MRAVMPPKLRAGHLRYEVLPSFEALARTLLSVLDLVAAAGEERDDRPRLYATTLARWARDEATPEELGAANRALDDAGWRKASAAEQQTPWRRVEHAANSLASWRTQCMKFSTHARFGVPRCASRLAAVLVALGEAEDAAAARVAAIFAQHFTAIAGHAPQPFGSEYGPVRD